MVNKDTLIISMTSWPKRIDSVHVAWLNIINQINISSNIHCLLVLSKEEFPNLEKGLPNELLPLITGDDPVVELLWDEGNIKSHKKIIPCLEKYPDNKVLVVDDDILYPKTWLQKFIYANDVYSDEILCGELYSCVFLEKDGKIYEKKCTSNYVYPNGVSVFGKPANGRGGTLYPAHTFTDKRFFDRKLLMELAPYSDEVWQYVFNVIEGKNIRLLKSDYNPIQLYDTDKCALYKKNEFLYDSLHNSIAKKIPEYKTALQNRINKIVVSLYSEGERLLRIAPVLKSIVNQDVQPFKFILNIKESDFKYITKEVLDIIKENNIHFFVIPKDLKSHNKYYYSVKCNPSSPVIVINDNVIYDKNFISRMLLSFLNSPEKIIASVANGVTFTSDNKIASYKYWNKNYNEEIDKSIFITMDYAILLPPNCFGSALSDVTLSNLLYDEDIYINFLINIFKFKVSIIDNSSCSLIENFAEKDVERFDDLIRKVYYN